MIKKLWLIFLIHVIFVLNAIAQQPNGTVTGKIIEESTKLFAQFVNVALVNSNDSTISDVATTDRKGNFLIDSIADGNYFLRISFIGFQTKATTNFQVTQGKVTDAGVIALKVSEILLKDVEITGEKDLFVNAIDRKVYYPEKDIQAQTGSAAEVMENIPSVSVDADGVVSLRGSENVTFLINGKPSGLMKAAPEIALQQIPATMIERIEIITNPSAKYKPDGAGGIINIVLKKGFKPGLNGTLTGNASNNNRYNGNLSLNYNPGKLNLFGTYGFRQNYNSRKLIDERINRDTTETASVFFEQHNSSTSKPVSHTANFGIDYLFNSRNKIGLSTNYFNLQQKREHTIFTVENDATGMVTNDYYTLRTDNEDEYEWESQASIEHSFKKKEHTILFEAGYEKFDELEENRFTDTFLTPVITPIIGHNTIRKSGNIATAVCEYANPITEDIELEAGYEGEFSKGDIGNSSEHYDPNQFKWITDVYKTNRFLYTQNIHAAYVTFSTDIEDFSFLAGLRAEQTTINSNLVTLDSVVPNNYFKIFPSLHLGYELDDNKKIGLSYSKRVNRPDPDELNPFPEYKDPRNIEAGNPNLLPEQVHSVELNYELKKEKFSFVPALFYRYTYAAFAEITRYVNDSTLLTVYGNLANNKSAGLELVLTYSYKKLLNLNLSGTVFYNTIDAKNIDYAENNSAVSWNSKLNATFNLSAKTKLQINTNYRSATLTAQGKSLPLYFVNAGLRHDLFKNKASLTLTASDILNTMKWEYKIDTDELYQKESRKRKSRIIYVGFIWRFGFTTKKSVEELQFDDKM